MPVKAPLDSLEAQLNHRRDYDSPPLQLWHPDCNGDIPIHIDSRGDWYHDGDKIERYSLVRLFASILRREEDDEYYLVTPAEKWRITVERHALRIIDFSIVPGADGQMLEACLNTGKRILVGEQHSLYLDPAAGGIAAMHLPHRLTALCTRAAWYRLVETTDSAENRGALRSGNYVFRLPTE